MSQSTAASASIDLEGRSRVTSALPLVGRILIAAIFLLSGASKIAAPAATIDHIKAAGLPLPSLGLGIAVIVEIGGGIALIAGYRTRLAAAILALFAIITALAFHNNLADPNQLVHFLKNVAMAGGLLQVAAFGAGRLSLDGARRARVEHKVL